MGFVSGDACVDDAREDECVAWRICTCGESVDGLKGFETIFTVPQYRIQETGILAISVWTQGGGSVKGNNG